MAKFFFSSSRALFTCILLLFLQTLTAKSLVEYELIDLRQVNVFQPKASLSWTADFETLPLYWVVERAEPQGFFHSIARLSSNTEKSFCDPSPLPASRYRVKAIWADGHQTFSNQIHWQILPLYFPLSLTPNPAWDQVMVSFPLTKEVLQLRLRDLDGKVVLQQSVVAFQTEHFFSIEALPLGTYLLEAEYQGQTYRTRLLKR